MSSCSSRDMERYVTCILLPRDRFKFTSSLPAISSPLGQSWAHRGKIFTTCLPAGFFMIWQVVPVLLFHRINCYRMSMWLALLRYLISVEIYHDLGPALSKEEVFRRVSYGKQLKAGLHYPGSAGLTSQRWEIPSRVYPLTPNCRS